MEVNEFQENEGKRPSDYDQGQIAKKQRIGDNTEQESEQPQPSTSRLPPAPDTVTISRSKQTTTKNSRMYEDIEEMMFGFGDNWPSHPETVRLVESVVRKYIADLAMRAVAVSEMRGKLDKECFMYVVRKDKAKFARVCQLLKAHAELRGVQRSEMKDGDDEDSCEEESKISGSGNIFKQFPHSKT